MSMQENIVNPLAFAALPDPYPHYARFQQDLPLARVDATAENSFVPYGSIWFVTRYDDATRILRDHEHFVQVQTRALPPEVLSSLPPLPMFLETWCKALLHREPPDHTRLRKLVSKAFTSKGVEALEPKMREIANQLIDGVSARGEMELLQSYCFPLPLAIISEMLGIPESDQTNLRQWASDLLFVPGPEAVERSNQAMRNFLDYADGLIEAKRRQPADDLTTALIRAEEDGDRLSADELRVMIVQLVFGGHETVARFLGNSVLALLRMRPQWEQLGREPAGVEALVEELLRCESSGHVVDRWAACDVELNGQAIRQGDHVIILLGAVNRDSEKFERPSEFDATRSERGHLAFGHGIHFCAGALLARAEAQIGLATLAQRLPDLRLAVAPDDLCWGFDFPFRGVRELPVAWDPK